MLIFLLLVLLPAILFLVGVYLGSEGERQAKIKSKKQYRKSWTVRLPTTKETYIDNEGREVVVTKQEIVEHYPNGLPMSPKLKLIAMVNGEEDTAQRLIDNEKRRSPGHFENWYIEKIIARLEREKKNETTE